MFTLGRGFNAIGSIDSNRTRLSWNNGELPPASLAHPQREAVLGPKLLHSGKKKSWQCALHPTDRIATFRGLAIKYDVTAAELRAANELGPFADDADLAAISLIRIPINAQNASAIEKLGLELVADDGGSTKSDPELADEDDGGQSLRSSAAPAAPKAKFDFFNKVDARIATLRKTSGNITTTDADADAHDVYRHHHAHAQVADEDAQSMHSMQSMYSVNSEAPDANT